MASNASHLEKIYDALSEQSLEIQATKSKDELDKLQLLGSLLYETRRQMSSHVLCYVMHAIPVRKKVQAQIQQAHLQHLSSYQRLLRVLIVNMLAFPRVGKATALEAKVQSKP